MRTELLQYLTTNLTGTIKTSNELPFEDGGNPLYIKNGRKVYLSEPQRDTRQLVAVLNGPDIRETVTSVSGYLTVDAKNRNADLDAALTVIALATTAANIPGSFRKEFESTSTLNGSTMTYQFEYRYYTIA